MKPHPLLAALPLCCMPALALQGGGLVKVDRQPSPDAGTIGDTEAGFDRGAWRAQLTDPSLDRREAGYARLVEVAADDPEARGALEDWAADESDADLAWTARLALRELDRTRRGARIRFAPPAPSRTFLAPVPGRVFAQQIDPFDGIPGFDFGALEERLHALLNEPSFGMQWAPGTGTSRAESFQLHQGPEGVRLEIETNVDGEQKTQTYEAESLEKLLETNPELAARIGNLKVDAGSTRDAVDRMLDELRGGAQGTPRPDAVPTDVLGVFMREAADRTEAIPGVPDGIGLLVERILPGTIADVVGVRRGDVLLELNGAQLRTGADVSRVLAERRPDEAVELTLVDGQGERRTVAWRPAPSGEF